jgi:hypothetical protein
MMRKWLYIWVVLLGINLLAGCGKIENKPRWNITLASDDKQPYGAWLAHQSLQYFFPNTPVQVLPRNFRFTSMDNHMKYDSTGRALLILEGLELYVADKEWEQLKEFAANGNEVIIFSSRLDHKIEEDLNCYKRLGFEEMPLFASEKRTSADTVLLTSNPEARFTYKGRSLRGYFSQKTLTINQSALADTSTDSESDNEAIHYPDTLGFTQDDPDMMRYSIGYGHITLHAAPLVLSNYFLLQPGNERYLAGIWQMLPEDINRIYWDDYYKRVSRPSSLEILWRYPATRLALLLGIFALLMYLLFESKRRQRIIPVIPPLKNESVSFAETVGRLYYNKGNHKNLAEKMAQQFLEWVRINYTLNTNLLNDSFVQQLTIRSGQPATTVQGLIAMIHELRAGSSNIDEAYLYQLYHTIQQFYKNK